MKKIILIILFTVFLPNMAAGNETAVEIEKFIKNPLRWGTSPAVIPPGFSKRISSGAYAIYSENSRSFSGAVLVYKSNTYVAEGLILSNEKQLSRVNEWFDNKESLPLPEKICAGCTAKILDGSPTNDQAYVFVRTHRQDNYLGLSLTIDLKVIGRDAMFEIIKLLNDYMIKQGN